MRTLYVCFVYLAFISCVNVYAQDPNESLRRHISVSGAAEVRVEPSRVVLTFGVETYDTVLATATKQNDERSSAIIAFAREIGVAQKDVQTDFISVEPIYDGQTSDKRARKFLHHLVRKTIVVLLRDVSKFETILSGSLERGATHVLAVRFETDKLREYRDRARVDAIRAAKEKAVLLATELGAKIGRVLTINEYGIWDPTLYWGTSWEYRGRGGISAQVSSQGDSAPSISPTAGDSLALGQLRINAQINVVFELQ